MPAYVWQHELKGRWIYSIAEVAEQFKKQAGVSSAVLDEFYRLYQDPNYWTMSIAFTATTGKAVR